MTEVKQDVGTLEDFRRLVRAIHSKGMAVVVFGNFCYCVRDSWIYEATN